MERVGKLASDRKSLEITLEKLKYQKELTGQSSLAVDNSIIENEKDLRLLAIEEKRLDIAKEAKAYFIKLDAINTIKDPKEKKKQADAAGEFAGSRLSILNTDLKKLKETNNLKTAQDIYTLAKATSANRAKDIDIETERLSIYGSMVDSLKDQGKLSEYGSTILKNQVELQTLKLSQEKSIADLQDRRNAAEKFSPDSDSFKSLDKELNIRKNLNNLIVEHKILQHDYQAALLQTEETMRKLERTGKTYSTEYYGALVDNFSDKLTAMIKAAKSAGDTFNQGLISAIDGSIDALAKAVQTSTLTLKGAIKYARNALSDVFRDAAAQTLKNAWKDIAKELLPKTKAEEKADEMAAAAAKLAAEDAKYRSEAIVRDTQKVDYLKSIDSTLKNKQPEDKKKDKPATAQSNSIENMGDFTGVPTQSPTAFDVPQTGDPTLEDFNLLNETADLSVKGADIQAKSTSIFGSSVNQFGIDGLKVMTGQMSAMTLFQKLIGTLSSTLFGFVSQLMSSMLGRSGASMGGDSGFLSGIGSMFGKNGGIGTSTGGTEGWLNNLGGGTGSFAAGDMSFFSDFVPEFASTMATTMIAKGEAFSGSASLSQYSNSVVDSPTMFAYAKGGVPSSSGLMGEAGPEAIMPLKRDSRGNLGISGSGSVNNNNITISINVEKGTSSVSGDQSTMAGQLGNAIKIAVNQEILRQTRPGGILAR
jgi:hypothetical protein